MNEWYKDGLSFSCQQCGNCCSGQSGYVWLTWDELEKINQYLENNQFNHVSEYIRRVGNRFSLLEKSNGDCIFLKYQNDKALCEIHPVKPRQCKTWPFWRTLLESKETWDKEAEDCPGMNQGKYYSVEDIRNAIDFTS